MESQSSKRTYSTKQVAAFLGLSVANLSRQVYEGRLPAPPKSPAGDYVWDYDSVNAAHWKLFRKVWILPLPRKRLVGTKYE